MCPVVDGQCALRDECKDGAGLVLVVMDNGCAIRTAAASAFIEKVLSNAQTIDGEGLRALPVSRVPYWS